MNPTVITKDLIDDMFSLFYDPLTSYDTLADDILLHSLVWKDFSIDLLTPSPMGGNTIFHLVAILPCKTPIRNLFYHLYGLLTEQQKATLFLLKNNSGKTISELCKDFGNDLSNLYPNL